MALKELLIKETPKPRKGVVDEDGFLYEQKEVDGKLVNVPVTKATLSLPDGTETTLSALMQSKSLFNKMIALEIINNNIEYLKSKAKGLQLDIDSTGTIEKVHRELRAANVIEEEDDFHITIDTLQQGSIQGTIILEKDDKDKYDVKGLTAAYEVALQKYKADADPNKKLSQYFPEQLLETKIASKAELDKAFQDPIISASYGSYIVPTHTEDLVFKADPKKRSKKK